MPGCPISTSQRVAFQGQGCLDCGEQGSPCPLIIYIGLGSHIQSRHHKRTLLDTCPGISSLDNGPLLKGYHCSASCPGAFTSLKSGLFPFWMRVRLVWPAAVTLTTGLMFTPGS